MIKLSFRSPGKASKLLIRKARMLENAKNVGEIVRILSDILYLSEVTIYRDYTDERQDQENAI